MKLYDLVYLRYDHSRRTCSLSIHEDAGGAGFYAITRDHGCSKTRSTPEAAIDAMLGDHACTRVSMIEVRS